MAAPAADPMTELTRGIVDLHVKKELEERLASGKPLRVKCGFDPTRPDLHIGHAVVMQKMRQFQDFGHTAILLVGEFTAMVGDPTGKNPLVRTSSARACRARRSARQPRPTPTRRSRSSTAKRPRSGRTRSGSTR
jgi:tyrosyl-tRNA synthetase